MQLCSREPCNCVVGSDFEIRVVGSPASYSIDVCVREPIIDPLLDVCVREPIMDPLLEVCVREPIMDPLLDNCVREPIMDPSLMFV